MYVVSESSHKVFDKIDDMEVSFNLSFLSAENIGFLDKEKELIETEVNCIKEFGRFVHAIQIGPNFLSVVHYIDYDNFSAGKAAKIAYLISKSEIEQVTDIIYSAYMEIIDKEINKSAAELKMTDIFNNPEI